MPNDPKFEIGDRLVGLDTRKNLKGKVIDKKETTFGMRFVLLKINKGGGERWIRTCLMEPRT